MFGPEIAGEHKTLTQTPSRLRVDILNRFDAFGISLSAYSALSLLDSHFQFREYATTHPSLTGEASALPNFWDPTYAHIVKRN